MMVQHNVKRLFKNINKITTFAIQNAGGYRSEDEEEDEDIAFVMSRVSASTTYEEAMMMMALRKNGYDRNKAVVVGMIK